MSLKSKSQWFLAVHLLLTVSVLSFIVLQGIQKYQKLQVEEMLAQHSHTANLFVRQAILEPKTASKDPFAEKGNEIARQLGLISGIHTILYDLRGEILGDSLPLSASVDIQDLLPYVGKGQSAYETTGSKVIYLSPLADSKELIGAVGFEYSLAMNQSFYTSIRGMLLYAGGAILLFSFWLGSLYYNRLSSGVMKLTKATQEIQKGRYHAVQRLKTGDELGVLSENIYYMGQEIKNHLESMKSKQAQLERSVERLTDLEKRQKDFIGMISHEFKTPLTVIKAYLELVTLYKEDERLFEKATTSMDKEATRLQEMVENILRLAALDRYNLESHAEYFSIGRFLEELKERLSGKASKMSVQLTVEMPEIWICADKEILSVVFLNLLDNAIKYNRPGGYVKVTGVSDAVHIQVEIRDTGIGIPSELREVIFEPFATAHKSLYREMGGTGLGLALVRPLIGRIGGSIELTSHEEGSSFIVILPKPCPGDE
ncbi:HAMP domain-containing sensor histidine kinase [Paenibacillus sp. FJAT-26967]|uniref:sensor histidine kinase n=1 Tax=Paenibacillus sp. FJAT-26967 TaxID=1729690 RepID=UPI00083865F1|nr:HAMP domain-containing sensor histidine kinase [Paenibacillus sp. FJAT-26967]